MNATEERAARVKRRRAMKTLTLSQTRAILRYIATVDQPEHPGGFHDNTILAARSALHHLNGRCKCGARLVPVCARLVADAWPKRKTCTSNTRPQRMARPSAGATYAGGDGSGSLKSKGE